MRILVATGPFAGHTYPTTTLVRALVARGHAVTWVGGRDYADAISATGATPLAMERAAEILMTKPGAVPLDVHILHAMQAAPLVQQHLGVHVEAAPDVVVADPLMLGAARYARKRKLPVVTLGIVPALYVDPDVDLHLQCCVDGFEYPRPDLPQLLCIGPLLPEPGPWTPPDWWLAPTTRPAVAVVQGTLDTDPDKLARPAIAALADLPMDGIVIAPGLEDVALPPNVHVLPWVPYAYLAARVSGWITNGGYGGIAIALAAGRPIITAGTMDDKVQVGERVTWAGVGIDLATETPTVPQLTQAIADLAMTPRYVERAREFAARAARTNAPLSACWLIEQLVRERQKREEAA